MTDEIYERAAELLEADLGDEVVALNPLKGTCFGFNEVTTTVWRLLSVPRSKAVLLQSLLNEFEIDPIECNIELGILLNDMLTLGLIHRTH